MSFFISFEHAGGQPGGLSEAIHENELYSGTNPFCGAEQDPPVVHSIFLEEKNFNFSTTTALGSAQSGGDDARIIQNQNVTSTKVIKKITKLSVDGPVLRPLQHQQL